MGRHKLDLTGQKFGRLTVLEDVGRRKGRVLWRCLCDCGAIVDIGAGNLQNGKTQSCGCYKREQTSKRSRIDLIGQKFGRLTVLEDVGRNKHRHVIWRCLCDCGNTVDVIAGHCYAKERTTETHSGKNHHNWRGGITSLNIAVRNCTRYKEWRTQVFQRDDFTCVHCNQIRRKLNAHHTTRFSKIMKEHNITSVGEAEACEALWNTDNGITLCKKCHKKEHARLRALTILT